MSPSPVPLPQPPRASPFSRHPRSIGLVQRTLRFMLAFATAILATACSTTRPWINQPIDTSVSTASIVRPAVHRPAEASSPSIVAAVTLSGGGARAAAFGLGVLQELKATRVEFDGRQTTLLDEVGLISGVSGGSVLATYYAAFGDQVFTRFEHDFLLADFQSSLIHDALSPSTLHKLGSPWYGRSNALSERLDTVFRGKTFGDLRVSGRRSRLLVTATDLTTGAPFEFTPEQFALICSDLDSVPLSFAVAASSAVPVLLSPMTIRNYAGSCPAPVPILEVPEREGNLSARLLDLIARGYSNSNDRPYIHLVDGGLADNLGVRSLLDHAVAGGSLGAGFNGLPARSVHSIVLVSVNSERDTAERIDRSDRVPGTAQVLDALIFGAGARQTRETTMMLDETARRLALELLAERGRPGSPFADDAEIHVINVSLRDLRDASRREALLQVPTALTVLPVHVRQLQAAGRTVLRESPAFQRLLRRLAVHGAASEAPF